METQYCCGQSGAAVAPSGFCPSIFSPQHFHFWCTQGDETWRGFSPRKAAPREPRLRTDRVEVKMPQPAPRPDPGELVPDSSQVDEGSIQDDILAYPQPPLPYFHAALEPH